MVSLTALHRQEISLGRLLSIPVAETVGVKSYDFFHLLREGSGEEGRRCKKKCNLMRLLSLMRYCKYYFPFALSLVEYESAYLFTYFLWY